MTARVLLNIGAVLMVLLGLARGAGGVILLMQGPAADSTIRASAGAVSLVSAFLVLVGLALVGAAVGVFRRLRRFWLFGLICTVVFVIDGAINGYVLYGRPGGRGTLVNVILAALILGCLLAGKDALRASAAERGDATDEGSRRR